MDLLSTEPLLRTSWFGFALTTLLLSSCRGAQLPACVVGAAAPTNAQQSLWKSTPAANTLDLGIDGSGSMLGLTGSSEALTTWRSLLKGVNLAAASEGLTLQSKRVGSGSSTKFESPLEAADPCFFRGCGGFKPVTSSLDSLWKEPGLDQGQIPLRMVLSDLEVNNGDIAKLVGAIKPHVEAGAVIAVLALQLPFQGQVYNSRGEVIHQGEAKRPIFLLATGPRDQLHTLMRSVKTKAALAGVPAGSMKLTHLEDQANRTTLTAQSRRGLPADAVGGGVPIRLGGTTYSPAQNAGYQFAKLFSNAKGLILSSSITGNETWRPDLGLIQLEEIPLPGHSGSLNGVSIGGFAVNGSNLSVKIDLSSANDGQSIRASVPRGQLPEPWWLQWNRSAQGDNDTPENQTDGLMLLMTSLGKLMVAPGTTPAAAFCLLTSS